MRPRALPRCAAGHVSATSAAPVAHSPPMPRPSTRRQSASCSADCESAAGGRRDRVDEDRRRQRPRAADAVGQPPEQRAAEGRRGERQRQQQAARPVARCRTRCGRRSGRTSTAGRPSRRASSRARPPRELGAPARGRTPPRDVAMRISSARCGGSCNARGLERGCSGAWRASDRPAPRGVSPCERTMRLHAQRTGLADLIGGDPSVRRCQRSPHALRPRQPSGSCSTTRAAAGRVARAIAVRRAIARGRRTPSATTRSPASRGRRRASA